MENQNQKKARLLGESFGAATNKLRKSLLFHFADALDLLNCYRCGEMIATIDDFSIEHKNAWASAEEPSKAFYDINNIAFSHLLCNTKAGMRYKKWDDPRTRRRELARAMRADPEQYKKHLEWKKNWYHKNKLK